MISCESTALRHLLVEQVGAKHGPSHSDRSTYVEGNLLLLSLEPAHVIHSSLILITTCLIFFDEIFCIGVPASSAGGTPLSDTDVFPSLMVMRL
jgi:hypothetical protein